MSLSEVEVAIRSAWSPDTCDESDVSDWSPDSPARGQCGVTALTLHDLLGGDLLMAEVLRPDGSRQGYHWWNRLAGGLEVDLRREQFMATELVQDPRVVPRPPGLPRRREEYLRVRARVFTSLGIDTQPPAGA